MANRYTTHLQVAPRRPTVSQIPFEAMNANLQAKQQMYNAAEEFETINKAKISALSSPISDHDKYLQDLKTNYLKEALDLHNTIEDKGSGEYRKQLNTIVSTYASDRKRIEIEKSGVEYGKYISDKAKKINDSKYTPNADWAASFKGTDAQGNIVPFVWTGMRDIKDFNKIVDESIKATQPQTTTRSGTTPAGETWKRSYTVKSWQAIKNGILNSFASDPEALQDAMVSWGVKNEKQLDKHVEMIAKNHTRYDSEESNGYDVGKMNYNKENEEASNAYLDAGEVTFINPHKSVIMESIDPKTGKLIPTGGRMIYTGPRGFPGFSGLDRSEENTIKDLKEKGVPIESIMRAAVKFGQTKEAFLKDYLDGTTKNVKIEYKPPGNQKERIKEVNELKGGLQFSKLFDENGIPVTGDKLVKIVQTIDANNFHYAGELGANNTMGAKTKGITIEGQKFFVAQDIVNPETPAEYYAQQENTLFNSSRTGNLEVPLRVYIPDGKERIVVNGKVVETDKPIQGDILVTLKPGGVGTRIVEVTTKK